MAKEIPSLKLKSGHNIPALGLGTWKLTGRKCRNTVRKAIEMGYRHIDTAEVYRNHSDVGKAIKGFDRQKLFITSKVWRDDLRYDDVLSACERALKELGTDYLDLYLIHWPNRDIPVKETLDALKSLQEEGRVRSIGVSNFTIHHVQDALKVARIPISVNQVEFHPHLYQKELLGFCKRQGIALTAYSPLGRGNVLSDNVIKNLAGQYRKTPAQVCLRWLLQKGIVVIPKASSEEHLRQNMEVFGWKLSGGDVTKIDSIGIKERLIDRPFGEFDY